MNRTSSSSQTRDLARWLLSYEEAAEGPSAENVSATFRMCEKLRRPLSTLIGSTGFRSLLARALTVAKREDPMLDRVLVREDGSLEGMNELPNGKAAESGAVLIAALLSLLVTFIGEALTVQLLQDVWPDLPGFDRSPGGKEST